MFPSIQAIRENRERGFTLIELLVVILIVGTLTSVAVPVAMNQRKSAVESTLKSDLRNAGTVLQGQKKFTGSLAKDTKTSEGVVIAAMRRSDRDNKISVSQFEDGASTGWGTFLHASGSRDGKTEVFQKPSDGYKGMNYRRVTMLSGTGSGGHTVGFPLAELGKQGEQYSVGIAIRSNRTKCVTIHIEFKGPDGGHGFIGGIDSKNVCVQANEWQYFTATGAMDKDGSNDIHLSTYGSLTAGDNIDVTGAVLVKGAQVNPEAALDKTGYDYCLQGYHKDDPNNIWRYSTLDGGVAEGRC